MTVKGTLINALAGTLPRAATPAYAGNTFTLTVGQDDPKTPTLFGYSRSNAFGSISNTGYFLDIYGTNTHRVDSLFKTSTSNTLTFAISGTTTVTNDTWTSITVPISGGTTTLNRSAASYTNLGGTGGQWIWSSFTSTMANGTVTLA